MSSVVIKRLTRGLFGGGDRRCFSGQLCLIQTLDVGFNPLAGARAFADLSALPALRRLLVQSCGLTALGAAAGAALPEGAFRRLEELDLAGNRLKGEALASLAALPAVRVLSLRGNRVRQVPELMARGASQASAQAVSTPGDADAVGGELNTEQAGPPTGDAPPPLGADAPGLLETRVDLPFPALEELSLVDNLVEGAAGVSALAVCLRLRSLSLWGNPIATRTRSLLPRGWREARAGGNKGRAAASGVGRAVGRGAGSSKSAAEAVLSETLSQVRHGVEPKSGWTTFCHGECVWH